MDETLAVENKTLVDKLYSLRAGLSLIAVKKDEVVGAEQSKSTIKNKKFNERKLLMSKRSDCKSRRGNNLRRMTKENNEIASEIDSLKRELKTKECLKRMFQLQIKVLAGGEIARAILLYWIGIWLAILTFPIFAIIEGVNIGKLRKELKGLLPKLKTAEQIDEIWKSDKVYIELTKEIEALDKQIAECDDKERLFNENKQREIEEQEAIIEKARNYSITLHNALISEYSGALDQRDWNNIDLIIYNMETGRADTLKEALQQVDNYRNTEKIVGAIRMATQAICSTISMENDRMTRLVSNCTDAINSRLDTLDSSMKSLIKVDEMKNAMLKKSNLTSDELVKEIKLLRESI